MRKSSGTKTAMAGRESDSGIEDARRHHGGSTLAAIVGRDTLVST